MKIYCKGRAIIEHAINGESHEIFPDELGWEPTGGSERNMGPEELYEALVDHDELGELRWSLSEYPIGVENYKNTDVGKHRLVGPVALSCRPRCSFKPPSVRKRQGFSSPMLSGDGADCRTL
ncbi:hypothetical protein SAMN04488032_1341 [Pacificibacter marinus]|uniref:Uncharacterized protein n=1 Tax=Pacificibacter marinus TaxID=658057 RepID=A0A1Y5T5D2_9RHOB|nr:hypothetical protein SAMN04488032_1341 [Pacificibacter marinus]SLN52754.1 hypothetical protein PAM7971_02684 [Pacificibacter marinus]